MDAENVKTQPKESKIGNALNKFFHFYDLGGNMKSEIYAGISMFIVSIFLILFNMQLIHDQFYASEVYPTVYFGLYFGATLVSFLGTIAIGLIARLPLVQVSGLGMSSAIMSLVGHYAGLSYGNIMAISFVSALIYVALVAIPFVRNKILNALPSGVKKALPALVGAITAIICLKNSKIIDVSNGLNIFKIGEYFKIDMYGVICLITLLAIIVSYVFASRNEKGHPMFFSLFVGLGAYFVLIACYGLLNISSLQLRGFIVVITDDKSFGFIEGAKAFGNLLSGNESGSIAPLLKNMWDFSAVKDAGGNVFTLFLEGIVTFLAVGLFGSYGVARHVEKDVVTAREETPEKTSFKNLTPSAGRALLVVSATNVIAPFLGVMPMELSAVNAVGKKDKAKTCLASFVTGLCFLVSMFTMAIFALFATSLGNSAYGHANEFAASISGVSSYIVYFVMFIASLSLMASIKDCDFTNRKEYLPMLLTIIVGFFTMNIAYGVGSGALAYLVLELLDLKNTKKQNLDKIISSSVLGLVALVVFFVTSL